MAFKILTGRAFLNNNEFFSSALSRTRGSATKFRVLLASTQVGASFFSARVVPHLNKIQSPELVNMSINSFRSRAEKQVYEDSRQPHVLLCLLLMLFLLFTAIPNFFAQFYSPPALLVPVLYSVLCDRTCIRGGGGVGQK